MLGIALVAVYFTFTLNAGGIEVVATTVAAWVVIALYLFLCISDALQQRYILGVLRNPLQPKDFKNVVKFKRSRKLLHFFSIPRQLIIVYGEL